MSRSFFAALIASQAFVTSAMAATPFLVCKTADSNAVNVQVSHPYNDSVVRVSIQEVRGQQGVVSSLNDLTKNQAHDKGVFANQMFRLEVSPYATPSGAYKAKIAFFYDNGVRAAYDLVCSKAR